MCRGVAVAVGALSFLTCNLKRWTLQISWRSLMRWWWQHSEEVWLRILRRGCWSVPTSCTSVVSQTTNAGTILKPCGLSYVCWWVLQDEISITQFAELSLRVIWNRLTKIDGHSFSLDGINPPRAWSMDGFFLLRFRDSKQVPHLKCGGFGPEKQERVCSLMDGIHMTLKIPWRTFLSDFCQMKSPEESAGRAKSRNLGLLAWGKVS